MQNLPHSTSTPQVSPEKAVRDSRRRNFYWADNDFLDKAARIVEPSGVAVYCLLCRYASNETQLAWPSVPTMATMLGITEPTVGKGVKALQLCGIIEVIERRRDDGGQMSNAYRLIDFSEWTLEHGTSVLNELKTGRKAKKKEGENSLPSPPNSFPPGQKGGKNSFPNQYQVEKDFEINTHTQPENLNFEKNKFSSPDVDSASKADELAQMLIDARLEPAAAKFYARTLGSEVGPVLKWWRAQRLDLVENPQGLLVRALQEPEKYLSRQAPKNLKKAAPEAHNGGGAYEPFVPSPDESEEMEPQAEAPKPAEPVYALMIPELLPYLRKGYDSAKLDALRAEIAPFYELPHWEKLKQLAMAELQSAPS